jgi:hypothetical protein
MGGRAVVRLLRPRYLSLTLWASIDTAPRRDLPRVFLDVGVGHGGSWRCPSSWSGRWLAGGATGRSSTVEVAASPRAVRLGLEVAFQLHQTPDPGAIGTELGLDVGGRLTDGGQVDAEQLCAPLQRRCDRPAHVRSCQVPTTRRRRSACRGGGRLQVVAACATSTPGSALPGPSVLHVWPGSRLRQPGNIRTNRWREGRSCP